MFSGSFKKQKDEAKEKRLEQLRKIQGRDVEYYKDELFSDLNLNKDKLVNSEIDREIYNV